MSVKLEGMENVRPMRVGSYAMIRKSALADHPSKPQGDQIDISQEGRDANAPQEDGEFVKLEHLLSGADESGELRAMLEEWRQNHPESELTPNWNAAVDPDGSIRTKAYMESLASQCESLRGTIEAYYQEGHQENLRFSNPYNHLVEKYQYSGSAYFRGDMSQAQWEMAFRQEKALLLGGRVALNDPWALASTGGVPKGEAMEKAARGYAQSVIDGLIAEYKKLNGIE